MAAELGAHEIEIRQCADCTDAWVWVAFYKDGTHLPECSGLAPHKVVRNIDMERLDALAWLPRYEGLPQVIVRMEQPGMRPILFRRRLVTLSMDGQGSPRQTIHCLGWTIDRDGHELQSFTFMFEDGSVLVSPDRNAV